MIDKSSLLKSQGSLYLEFIPKDGLFHKMLLLSLMGFLTGWCNLQKLSYVIWYMMMMLWAGTGGMLWLTLTACVSMPPASTPGAASTGCVYLYVLANSFIIQYEILQVLLVFYCLFDLHILTYLVTRPWFLFNWRYKEILQK